MLLAGEALGRECDRGDGEVGDDVHALCVEPATQDRGSDVRFVLVIGVDDLDRVPSDFAAKILHSQFDRRPRPVTADIPERSRFIGEHADADRLVRSLSKSSRDGDHERCCKQAAAKHSLSSFRIGHNDTGLR